MLLNRDTTETGNRGAVALRLLTRPAIAVVLVAVALGAVLGVKHLIGTRLGDAETLIVCVLVGAGVYSLVI